MGTDTNNLPKLIGKRIRIERIKREIAQEELAEKADIHRTTMSKVERGIGYPAMDTLVKIANALDINIEDLLSDTSIFT